MWWLLWRLRPRRRHRTVVVHHHHHYGPAPVPVRVVVRRSWWEAAGAWWGRQSFRTRCVVIGVILVLVLIGAITGPAPGRTGLDTQTTP